MFVSIFIYSVIIMIVLLPNKRIKDDNSLSKQSTLTIKGILAIGIFFHHISQGLQNNNYITNHFIFFGNLFVGGFLFISGYGLFKSYYLQKDYLKYFLKNRLLSILIPYFNISLVMYIYNYMIGIKTELPVFIKSFINFKPYVTLYWYVYLIVILYITYYFFMLIIKNKRVVPYEVLIVTIFATIICKKIIVSYWWYHAIIAFPIGMLYFQYENSINKIINSKYLRLIIISIVAFLSSTHFLASGNYYLTLYKSIFVELIQIISFCFLLILSLKKYVINNKLFELIGKVSYEIYLTQVFVFGLSILILGKTIGINDVKYFSLSCILIIPISYIFNLIHKKILLFLLKR